MRAPRALSLAAAALVWLVVSGPSFDATAQEAPLGAVNVVQDGWWSRARGGNPPLTSPSLPNAVPQKGLAVSASNGEPDKMAAVGITISGIEMERFARLILNLRESTETGTNQGSVSSGAVGTVGGSVRACPATAPWVGVKGGEWVKQPAFDAAQCVTGARSTDTPATWSFDLSTMTRQWIDGTLAQNGVVLSENVNAPVTFQAAWGDSTTPDLTLSLDLVPAEEPEPTFDDEFSSDFDSDTTSSEPVPTFAAPETFEFSSADSFTTPQLRPAPTIPAAPAAVATPIGATSGPPPKPNLFGNLPLGVVLLGGLAIGLALVTSYSLGPAGSPAGVAVRRQGGVSRALARRESELPMEASN